MNTTFALGNGLKVIDLTKPLDPKKMPPYQI